MDSPALTPTWVRWARNIVWYIVAALEILLLLRFVLKLFGADSTGSFTHYTYMLTDPLTVAFTSIFNVSQIDTSTFEWTTLLAMALYALIGWGISALIISSAPTATTRINRKVVPS